MLWILPTIAGVVLLLAGTGRARLWLRGRPDPALTAAAAMRGLLLMPRRYLVDVHHVVARKPRNAWMHALVAGGLLAAFAAMAAAELAGPDRSPIAIGLALAACAAGAGIDLWRRRRDGAHLSRGAYARLPRLLMLACGLLALALILPAPFGLWMVGAPVAAGLALALARGPLRHALVGALHLAFHPRADRFDGRAAVGPLRPPADPEMPVGVAAPGDFLWTQLLSFDACVQCGRCEAACPAFAAGQPLNPKALIAGLARAAGAPEPYAGAGHPGVAGGAGLPGPDTLWSCTTCGACVEACPMLIEHLDAVVDLRRNLTAEAGEVPVALSRRLEALRTAGTPDGQPTRIRNGWMAGAGVRVLDPGARTDVLLWLGEASLDETQRGAILALTRLLRRAGVDFATLGEAELDCGDLACRAGDEDGFRRLALHNIAVLNARGFDRIVSPDPHAVQTLGREYRRFGAGFHVQHHSELLSELLQAGRLRPAALGGEVTFHDPCYLARYAGETEAPRRILRAAGLSLVEMARHGRQTLCCGGGGGAAIADIPGRARIPELRLEQARATGCGTLVIGCPGCRAMFRGQSDAGIEVRDLAQVLEDACQMAEAGDV